MQHHPEGYELPKKMQAISSEFKWLLIKVKRTPQFILLPLLSAIFTLNIYFLLLDSLEIPTFLKHSIF